MILINIINKFLNQKVNVFGEIKKLLKFKIILLIEFINKIH